MVATFGQRFQRDRLKLRSGGVFDCDAVSQDGQMAAAISTSASKTSGGKHAVGKIMKLRSDMFFLLLLSEVQRRMVVLTDKDMHAQCLKEKQGGRVPDEIEFFLAESRDNLRASSPKRKHGLQGKQTGLAVRSNAGSAGCTLGHARARAVPQTEAGLDAAAARGAVHSGCAGGGALDRDRGGGGVCLRGGDALVVAGAAGR